MNNFSCSLSCTWITIIDCLFYASDILSRDVTWEYIAKLLVAWLLPMFDLVYFWQTHELEAANKVLTDQVCSLTKRIDELETNNVNLQNELTKFTG